ncbi:calcium-translocating P-type ATPase, PMCA-type [Myxococcota bacterium]|nr:calcium-translocating P-type ATPase, PMCA-type [Myxococcota bacterium]MBU1534757.1 calcium-translocating P-type ATPase, PMCA-type [Myxococcota bacterium]
MSRSTTPHRGLDDSQILKSRKKHGSNALPPPPIRRWYQILLGVASDKTIIILSVAAAISIIISTYTGESIFEGLGIIVAVTIAVGVGFMSEMRSSQAFQSLLEESEKVRVKVVRQGKFHTISSDDLVVGDVVLLETGDKVPADGVVLHTVDLTCDTSMITGESASSSPDPEEELCRGYTILTGEGSMEITKVGMATEMGKIREALAHEPEPTPLQERLSALADKIGIAGTIAAVAIFVALMTRNLLTVGSALTMALVFKFMLNAFIVAVTIVVVAVPEGLPLAVTLNLALNMRRMAKDKNLVRTLAASETLGSVTVICSDKTGTLTLNRMRVASLWTLEKGLEDAKSRCNLPQSSDLYKLLLGANSTAHLEKNAQGRTEYVGNPTEGSLLLLLEECGIDYLEIRESCGIITRCPFSSARKMMSTLVSWKDGHNLLLVKGAPERVLEKVTSVSSSLTGEPVPYDSVKDQICEVLQSSAGKGERVLALAYARVPEGIHECQEHGLTLWGFAVIRDPVRKEVAEAIDQCRDAGIKVKMVTGDNPLTARAIADELGMVSDDDLVLEGDAFERMSDEEVKQILPRLAILARSRPHDKFRLVSLLKEENEVVAVTGDGTNDAPALKKADVGVSMGISGTEVAKEASDVVLLDDNFKSIVKGVVWGRSLQSNIKKFLQFQLTVNVAALTVAFVGALIGGRSPLTAVQLLWVNLIMDTLAAVALGLEPPAPDLLDRKPRNRKAPLISRPMWWMIMGMGLFTFVSLMILFRWNFLGTGARYSREHLSVIFTTFVFIQVFNEINARSIDAWTSPFKDILKSKGFLLIGVLIVVVQVLLTQFGGALFQTTPLSLVTWGKIVAFSSTALIMGAIIRALMRSVKVVEA